MQKILIVDIENLMPGQLYLNSNKVNSVRRWFNKDNFNDYIEVIENDEEYVVIDGHTRLYHAYINGLETVQVKTYTSNDELEMALYRACYIWCKEMNIDHISDLKNRIISADEFEEKWINRCTKWMEEHDE